MSGVDSKATRAFRSDVGKHPALGPAVPTRSVAVEREVRLDVPLVAKVVRVGEEVGKEK